jgi:hypothetical protein
VARRSRFMALLLGASFLLPVGTAMAAPTNDDFEDRIPVGIPSSFVADTSEATWQAGEPNPTCGENDDASVWYSFELTVETPLSIVVDDTDRPVSMTVLVGSALSELSEVLCNDGFRQGSPFETVYLFQPGIYALRISGAEESRGPAQVSIQERPWVPSAGDDWQAPIEIEYPIEMELDVTANSTQEGSPASCLPAYDDVWLRFTAPRREAIQISTQGSNYSTTVSIWRYEDGPRERIDCIHYWPQDEEPTEQATLPVALVENETYLVQIASRWQPYGRNRYLRIAIDPFEGPLHDEPSNPVLLEDHVARGGSIGGATHEPGEQPCLSGTRSSVWYSYTAATSESATVTRSGEHYFPSTVAIYEMSEAGLTRLACADHRIDLEMLEGTTYLIRVAGHRPVGVFTLKVDQGPPPKGPPAEGWRFDMRLPLPLAGGFYVSYIRGEACAGMYRYGPRICTRPPVPQV